jgi:transcriptional regulator with XRE-family HTH domain
VPVPPQSLPRTLNGSLGQEPWQKIRAARIAKGWSQEYLARQIGVSQPAIVNIERGWTVRSKYLSRIAKALDLDIAELDTGLAELAMRPDPRLLTVDFPIHATTEDGPGDMIVAPQPIQHTARPAPLAHVKGAYGVYVTGTSMEPEFRPGDILLVNPHLPVNPNEPYIFYAEHPVSARATIKWLRRVTDDRFLVTQHNPPPGMGKDLSLARKDWQWAHRVIGKYSRR